MPTEHEVAPKERKLAGKTTTKKPPETSNMHTLFPKVNECALTILLFFLEQKNCFYLSLVTESLITSYNQRIQHAKVPGYSK